MTTVPNVEPLLREGVEHMRAGHLREAEHAFTRVISDDHGNVSALHALAQLARAAGNIPRALTLYDRALELDPERHTVRRALAQLLLDESMLPQAVHHLSVLTQRDPAPELWHAIAAAHTKMGDHHAAIDAWRALMRAQPGAPHAAAGLATSLLGAGMEDDARRMLDELVSRDTTQPEVLGARAQLALGDGDAHLAEALLRRGLWADPQHLALATQLSEVLRQQGRLHEALRVLDALHVEHDTTSYMQYERLHLALGMPEPVMRRAAEIMAEHPFMAAPYAMHLQACWMLGAHTTYARWTDPKSTVHRSTPPLPPGQTLEAFAEALAEHALNDRTLRRSPIGHATVGGLHSGDLLASGGRLMDSWHDAIRGAVFEAAQFMHEQGHPWAHRIPRSVGVHTWAIILRGEDHQAPHIHPEAWCSGVFYARMPETPKRSDAGALVFGRCEEGFGVDPDALPTHTVRPEEGELLVFPSYLYHHTVPTQHDGARVSLAFDVVALH